MARGPRIYPNRTSLKFRKELKEEAEKKKAEAEAKKQGEVNK